MSSRLGVSGAFNRRKTLSPLPSSPLNQDGQKGSYTKIINENKVLKEKNVKMKEELQELRSALKQITSESAHEKFDERRINLLKFQVIQLERQIAMLNDSLGFRSEAILETENSMAWLADKLRSYLSSEVKGPTVSISRSDLTLMIESLESARIKLFKAIEKCSREEVGKDILLLNPFLNDTVKQKDKLTVLDICLGKLDYLNLKHVAQLESKLCKLYKELVRVHEQLQFTPSSQNCAQERLMEQLLKSSLVVKDVTDDLMALSLLCPSSPWPILSRPLFKEVPAERVISALPSLPRSKREDVEQVIRASVGTCNYRYHLLEQEKAVLKEELAFHRSVYELQIKSIKDLFDALRGGYIDFERSARDTICLPLQNLLDAYKTLKKSTSEAALRDFLLVIKENEAQLASVIDLFKQKEKESTETDLFGAYGADLMSRLQSVSYQCQQQRDEAVKSKKSVREEYRNKERELLNLLEELETKYENQWVPPSFRTNLSKSGSRESIVEPTTESNVGSSSNRSNTEHKEVLPASNDRSRPNRIIVEDPFILRSYLDDESDWVSVIDETASKSLESNLDFLERNEKKTENLQMTPSRQGQDFKQSMCNSSKKKGPTKPVQKWVPDKQWVNDFTSPRFLSSPDPLSGTPSSVQDKSSRPPTEGEDCDSCSEIAEKGLKSKKKVATYKPNLKVAQTCLRLKTKGVHPSIAPDNSALSSKSNGT